MPVKSYIPKLYAEGVEIPISGFSLDAPEGKIGLSLGFDIPDQTTDVQRGDEIDFDIEVGAQTASLIVAGKATSRNKSYGSSDSSPRPSDGFSCSAADSLGEGRLSITPRVPIILYDPASTTLGENETDTKVNDADGNRIYAEARAIASLDVIQALNIAYVEGAGFTEVITNIFNYPIGRIDFPLNTSFHNAIKGYFLSQYKPQIFEHDNRLFIINARGTLPTGFNATARLYTSDDVIRVVRTKPDLQPVNALLLTTHETGVQEIPSTLPGGITERQVPFVTTSGSTLTGDYQQTVVIHFIAQLHEDEANPSRITNEVTYKKETTITGQDKEGDLRQLAHEIQTDDYDYNFGRKRGYTRIIDGYVKRPGELPITENILTEICSIAWNSTGKVGEFIKESESLVIEGLVMIEGEEPDTIKTPLGDANRLNTVPDDAIVERQPILTRILTFRETGNDQIEVTPGGVDHLTGTSITGRVQDHTGTIRIQLRGTSTGAVKTTLLRDEASEADDGAREPITLDIPHLPFEQALPLGELALADAKEPPETLDVILLKPDFGLHRGSLRRVDVNRTGTRKLGIVTSYQIRGEQVEQGMLKVTQSFKLLVIGNA